MRGIYSATVSVINDDYSLNVEATIKHAETSIKNGLHGVIFGGSTGQSQLTSLRSKKELISKAATHKLKKQFLFGNGTNSLEETIDLIKYGMEFGFNDCYLVGVPAYFKNNTEDGVHTYFKEIISQIPKVKII